MFSFVGFFGVLCSRSKVSLAFCVLVRRFSLTFYVLVRICLAFMFSFVGFWRFMFSFVGFSAFCVLVRRLIWRFMFSLVGFFGILCSRS